MARVITIILVFVGLGAFGQNTRIDTLNLKKSEQFKSIQSDKMNYPVIHTGNTKTDSIINFNLVNKFTSNENPIESINSVLIEWAGDQIIFLDFVVTYNQKGILSLNISAEGCGAYCSNWTNYFNYSTITGEPLDISEVVDTSGEFRTQVYIDKESQYTKQKQQLKEGLNNPAWGLDKTTYEWALKQYENCERSFNLESFAIYPSHLEIIEFCYLPNAIKNLTPTITLEYKNSEIAPYLR